MKKLLLLPLLLLLFIPTASAGDCKARSQVNQEATISSAVFLRADCPEGENIGTVPAGEKVRILEVDKYNEFYLIETSVGTGFVFESFLSDIHDVAPPATYPESIFIDLSPEHPYYSQIEHVKNAGIVGGNPDGTIEADTPINRAALAKILVEASFDQGSIDAAVLDPSTYTDADHNEWYAPYLQLAKEGSIMTGDAGKNTVRPGADAKLAEVAKMISVAFFLDLDPEQETEAWYDRYIRALSAINALPTQDPSHVVTRGEMMFIISNVLNSQS